MGADRSNHVWRLCWAVLAAARVVLACVGRGYIHPDEHFQAPEVAASWVFGFSPVTIPWEYQPGPPAYGYRSILWPLISSWGPFHCLRAIASLVPGARIVTATSLLLAPRLLLVAASFVHDAVAWRLARRCGANAWQTVTLLACGWPCLVLLSRPFSNAGEAMALTLALAVAVLMPPARGGSRLAATPRFQLRPILLGCVTAAGVFVRFTFVGFVGPAVVYCLMNHPSLPTAARRIKAASRNALFLTLGFLGTCVPLVAMDTAYYGSPTPAFKPLSLLLYNLNPENLAQHGTHPRWLHAAVNMPLLFGPGLLLTGLAIVTSVARQSSAQQRAPQPSNVVFLMVASVLVPLALLSAAPHQEPRFLLPLVVPVAVLAGCALSRWQLKRPCALRGLGVATVLFHIVLAVVFGCLHNSGVVTASEFLEAALHGHAGSLPQIVPEGRPRSPSNVHIVFYKTYMPPTYLLAHNGTTSGGESTPRVLVHDTHTREELQRVLQEVGAQRLRLGTTALVLVRPVATPLMREGCATPAAGPPPADASDLWAAETVVTFHGHLGFDVAPSWGEAVRDCRDGLRPGVHAITCALRSIVWDRSAVAIEAVRACSC